MQKQSEKTIAETDYINILRVTAAIAVIVLHLVCTPVSFCGNLYSKDELFVIRLVKNLMNWCVPVFVMITGVLLLNKQKEITLKKLYMKYIRRFLLVILSFGTLYALIELIFKDRNITINILFQALINTLTGKSWDHMWYVYMSIGLYMIIPALKSFVDFATDKILYYTLFLLFIFSSFIPYISFFITLNNNFLNISVYIFYLLFGYVIHYKRLIISNKYAVLAIIVYGVYLSLIQLNPVFITENTASLYTVEYSSPIVVIVAWAIFSLCTKVKNVPTWITTIAPLTFGIYIIHPIAINFCYKFLHLTVERFELIPSLLITAFITFSFSILGTWILRLIPAIRKYIL